MFYFLKYKKIYNNKVKILITFFMTQKKNAQKTVITYVSLKLKKFLSRNVLRTLESIKFKRSQELFYNEEINIKIKINNKF